MKDEEVKGVRFTVYGKRREFSRQGAKAQRIKFATEGAADTENSIQNVNYKKEAKNEDDHRKHSNPRTYFKIFS